MRSASAAMARAAFALSALVTLSPLRAQDGRTVTEPAIPRSCMVLPARSAAPQGSPAGESKTDTFRIQQELDRCPSGQAVELRASGGFGAFLSGPLQLRQGVTLLIGRGAILFASRNPRDYDVAPGSCGIVNRDGHGCKPFISADGVANSGVMGDGAIDGRGGERLIGQDFSWWDLAQRAKVQNANQNCPRLMHLTHASNFTLYRITLRNAANFHVLYANGDGFTAWGVIVDSPKTARNTDGIDVSGASNVTITHCFIHAGDDNVAIKAGSSGPSSRITIEHNHFYTGHGMSIGSETNGGVSAIRVSDLSIDGADNGIRIKSNSSRGGLVRDVIYSGVCIRESKNPIILDSNYSFYGELRNLPPTYQDIVLRNVRVLGPGKITLDGFDEKRPLGVTFDNVTLSEPQAVQISARHARLSFGPGPVNFRPAGEDVEIAASGSAGAGNSCGGKFIPFPVKQ